ncbi:MAG: hypothetical protein CSA82_03000 [Actinobacteria bacterium]|nr:MAG: hypothetical protein CSA82_03000 [Actinomycetota bacterium]
MGKASRRKKLTNPAQRPAYRAPIPFVDRPYEGLEKERELVAMREIIPCAVMSAQTNKKHGSVDFDFVTLLPDGHPALVRGDGRILVGLQTRSHSGDLSHDAAAALLAAIDHRDKGKDGVVDIDVRDPAPRLQDVLDLKSMGDMELFEDFSFWLDPNDEVTDDVQQAIERNRAEIVPTVAVPGTTGMYWCEMNANFVRYVTDMEEHKLFNALARLHAADKTRMGEGSRFVGAFRACGIVIPVFELAEGATATDIASDAAAFAKSLEEALTITDPLSPEERRARDGLVSRQVTIR